MLPPCRVARLFPVFLSAALEVAVVPARAAGRGEAGPGPLDPNPLEWKLATGFDYSQGDYRLDDDTRIFVVPLSAEVERVPFNAKLMLPLLVIDGPAGVLPDSTTSDDVGPVETTTGLGQIVGSVGYLLDLEHPAAPLLELTTKITAPTETSRELGTGEWAFALQLAAFRRVGVATPFGHFGRKLYTGSSLRDRFYSTLGASVRLTTDLDVGLAYDWSQATSKRLPSAHELSPFASFRMGRGWSFGPYAVVGLSAGGPDFALGFSLSQRWASIPPRAGSSR